jgi:glucosamine--fructose-6-phosphate aminotransferase (isomerizing)
MSGIFGYSGPRNGGLLVLGGLRRLEYRGCDSAGLAWIASGTPLGRLRTVGRVAELARAWDQANPASSQPAAGELMSIIGHTRWATHGEVSVGNAHPHVDVSGRLALVHNGIIDNHEALRLALIRRGVEFSSDTDSETLVQLIGYQYGQRGDLVSSLRMALAQVRGAYGVALVCLDRPGEILVACCGSPLMVGIGTGEYFVSSDAQALTGHASQVLAVQDREIVHIRPDGRESLNTVLLTTGSAPSSPREPDALSLTVEQIELGAYPHHLIREIHDQPAALRRCLAGRIDGANRRINLGGLTALGEGLASVQRAVLVGCGSSWHAAQVGEILFEELSRLPADARYASELRHRNAIVEDGTLAVAVSQSGETVDTLAALDELMLRGALGFGIVNVPGSSIAARSQAGAFLHAGEQKGAVSTKSFTTQVAVLTLIALEMGRRRHLSPGQMESLLKELELAPDNMDRALALDTAARELAHRFHQTQNWLLLGHGVSYPVALEGALKLKEISGIHAEGIPAAEIKHGPVALVHPGMPVIVVVPSDSTRDGILTNMAEVKGRGGHVIAITTAGDHAMAQLADEILPVPAVPEALTPLVTTIPLQLLAYHLAVARGRTVDRV